MSCEPSPKWLEDVSFFTLPLPKTSVTSITMPKVIKYVKYEEYEETYVPGERVQKYRLRKYAETVFGFSKKRWKNSDKDPYYTFVQKRSSRTADALANCVVLFFQRDDVSHL